MDIHIAIDVPRQILEGPKGLRLVLNAREIFPDNPGEGTPRLIEYQGDTMTFDCALDNITDLIGASVYEQAEFAYDWLISVRDEADAWLDYHSALVKAE